MQAQPPPFIAGLLAAKRVLLQLREKKVQMQGQTEPQNTPPRRSSLKGNDSSGSGRLQENRVREGNEGSCLVVEGEQSKVSLLKEKMNSIGSQLYACYCQNQSYEIILRQLAGHYAHNKNVAELNQKLKKKSFELQQHINEYKHKIQQNYQQIQNQQQQIQTLKQLTSQELTEYLTAVAAKDQELPLSSLPHIFFNPTLQDGSQEGEDPEGETENKLILRFRELGSQVTKKPLRRVQCEQEQIKKSFYQSELYSL